ncbi:MAG: hypothetical protein JXP34_04830 [Planctomycetes bacterium]|nr:hypothetical protein [Planctomycetota bacterium]
MGQREATFDESVKILLLRDPRPLAEWIFGRRAKRVRAIDPVFSTTHSRLADKLILAEFPDGRRTLLHVEFQLAGDSSMGRRMMAYVGLIAQLLDSTAYRRCGFRQVVIFVDRDRYRRDPGEFLLPGEDDCQAFVRYQVIRLWQVHPKVLREIRSQWLEPFVPLSRVGNVERAVVESRDRIRKSRLRPADRQELLACLCGVAGIRIRQRERLLALFRGIDMGESVIFKYWMEQGEARGEARGRARGESHGRARSCEEAAAAVLETLRSRFGRVPADMAKRIRALRDHRRLLRLIRAAAEADTIKAFRAAV